MKGFLAACCVMAGLATQAIAAPVSFMHVNGGVWSTGFGTNTVLLADASVDPHYTLIQVPPGCTGRPCQTDSGAPLGPNSYVVIGGQYPLTGTWINNEPNSRWIAPRANLSNSNSATNNHVHHHDTEPYIYRMWFNLELLGLLPSSASISLRWVSDNNDGAPNSYASHIQLCTGLTSGVDWSRAGCAVLPNSGNNGQNRALSIVNITQGFTAGWMALDFVVYNEVLLAGQNPTGLNVEILGASANVSTPEEATLALVGAGMILFAIQRRRLGLKRPAEGLARKS